MTGLSSPVTHRRIVLGHLDRPTAFRGLTMDRPRDPVLFRHVSTRSMPASSLAQQPPLKRLIRYSNHYRLQIWAAAICSVLNKLFDLAPPALIGIAVNVVVEKERSFLAQLGIESIFNQF